ncbi:MAG: bifunctional folylpolyglutamate synthase/dihydrofolate synthase [Candidatus Omnitrophica bacterium]|nr:bifunctional folylpolyglutamate synthase/dihydrofolate synthase [Candidatus Omnitrophota bacterium]
MAIIERQMHRMSYREAVEYIDSFINYEKIGYGGKGRDAFRLDRVGYITGLFGNPQDSFPSVHIAGTKGKGSIANFVSSILIEAGLRVGLYTSPHLISPRERIKLNNKIINEKDFSFYVGEIKNRLDNEKNKISPTFFELYTILALNYFRAKGIDFAVIETGLGGRLDATNVVKSSVSVIGSLSYDHTHLLGKTLGKIAFEKCGIIKRESTVITAPQRREAMKVIWEAAGALNARIVSVGKDITFREIYHDAEKEVFDIKGALHNYKRCTIKLLGRHQLVNACCAVGAVEALERKGIRISPETVKKGMEITENPSRCQVIARKPYIVLDGAQNEASSRALIGTIKRNFKYKRLILILGVSTDKDVKGISRALAPFSDTVILTKAKVPRALDSRSIKKFIKMKNIILTDFVEEAARKALAVAGAEDLILITGSFFVTGEAVKFFSKKHGGIPTG